MLGMRKDSFLIVRLQNVVMQSLTSARLPFSRATHNMPSALTPFHQQGVDELPNVKQCTASATAQLQLRIKIDSELRLPRAHIKQNVNLLLEKSLPTI